MHTDDDLLLTSAAFVVLASRRLGVGLDLTEYRGYNEDPIISPVNCKPEPTLYSEAQCIPPQNVQKHSDLICAQTPNSRKYSESNCATVSDSKECYKKKKKKKRPDSRNSDSKTRKSSRRFWVDPKFANRPEHTDWAKIFISEECDILNLEYRCENDFRNMFLLTASEFENLLQLVGPKIHKKNTKFRMAISDRDRLALTLRFLATGDSYHSLSNAFKFSTSSISKLIMDVCTVLVATLSDYIRMPQSEVEWKSVAEGFYEKYAFPNCVGVMDVKYTNIETPLRTDLYNYREPFSLIIFSIMDAHHNFLYASVDCQRSISDAEIYSDAKLYDRLNECSVNLPLSCSPPGSCNDELLPYVFVADDKFPLTKNIMVPYEGNFTIPDDNIPANAEFGNFMGHYTGVSRYEGYGNELVPPVCIPSKMELVDSVESSRENITESCGKNMLKACGKNVMDTSREKNMMDTSREKNMMDTSREKNMMEPCGNNMMEPCGKNMMEPCGKNMMEPCGKNMMDTSREKNMMEPCGKNMMEPCWKNMMEPYERIHSNMDDYSIYNSHVERVKNVSNNVFGFFPTVFRIFRKDLLLQPETATNLASAAIYLHNYLKKNDAKMYSTSGIYDRFSAKSDDLISPGIWRSDPQESRLVSLEYRLPCESFQEAESVRTKFKDYFAKNIIK